ncbi:MAG TPA: hypothetical protein DEF30_08265 [Proteiniclasticum sp.]|uniref:hypothetical protein n=1 Tax=Proteiniclasticum sp. TaxID=2053595 RepID=UPI000E84E420|nr:hypothetical protein [Proteiniclasticum sp.]HBW13795.1 hypothetical protein [Proteiniclasticum sp.]
MKYNAEILTSDKLRLEVKDLQLITDGSFTFTEQNFKEFILQRNNSYTFVGEDEILCTDFDNIVYVSIMKAD